MRSSNKPSRIESRADAALQVSKNGGFPHEHLPQIGGWVGSRDLERNLVAAWAPYLVKLGVFEHVQAAQDLESGDLFANSVRLKDLAGCVGVRGNENIRVEQPLSMADEASRTSAGSRPLLTPKLMTASTMVVAVRNCSRSFAACASTILVGVRDPAPSDGIVPIDVVQVLSEPLGQLGDRRQDDILWQEQWRGDGWIGQLRCSSWLRARSPASESMMSCRRHRVADDPGRTCTARPPLSQQPLPTVAPWTSNS